MPDMQLACLAPPDLLIQRRRSGLTDALDFIHLPL
jgi:hypothetical protein